MVLGGFVLASAALVWIHPPSDFSMLPALACMVVLALAARISFETPLGFTVPTQLAFVPLLFTMPVTLVPAGGGGRSDGGSRSRTCCAGR